MENKLLKLITSNYTTAKDGPWLTRGKVHQIVRRILKNDTFSSCFSHYKGEKHLIVTVYVGKYSRLELYFEVNGKLMERVRFVGYNTISKTSKFNSRNIKILEESNPEEDIKLFLEKEELAILKDIENILDEYSEISGKNLDKIRKVVKGC